MNKISFIITLLGLPFLALANETLDSTVRTSFLVGPNSKKDFSLGIDQEVSKETSLSFDYFYSKDTVNDQTLYFSADHDLNETQSINGSLLYSKDGSDLVGKGLELGTDYTLSDHWDTDRSTDLSMQLGITNYSKEEKVLTTTEKTNYEQIKASLELEQELSNYFSLLAGYKQYIYRDHSEVLTSNGKRKTSSTVFSSTESSIKNKYSLGGRLILSPGRSLTYRFSQGTYRDSLNEQEHDVSIRYKIGKVTLGFSYQYIKTENAPAEHWFGPKLSFKF